MRKSIAYAMIKVYIFKLALDHVLRRWIREDGVYDVIHACHNDPSGGNYVAKRTTYKVLQTRFYWPTLIKDITQYVSRCDDFERMGKSTK